MAQRTVISLIDDLDQSPADETVQFGLDGRAFEIDLSTAHAKDLREELARYIHAGRAVRTERSKPAAMPTQNTAGIRAWAAENGYQVNTRGRIPGEIVAAYNRATNRL